MGCWFRRSRSVQHVITIFVIFTSLVITSCYDEQSADQLDLTISAAASLADALGVIVQAYEDAHPNVELRINYAGSGTLARQIEQGAPVDVFLSASLSHMRSLVDEGLIDPHQVMLTNELVVIVPEDRQVTLTKLEDLLSDDIRTIAIGIPMTAPVGSYAREALEHVGIWEDILPKLVQGKDVRQVVQYVATGNTDAGIVYRSDIVPASGVKLAMPIEQMLHSRIEYMAGVVNHSEHREEAILFHQYISSSESRAVFERFGFSMQ